jgi:hypothetical protein
MTMTSADDINEGDPAVTPTVDSDNGEEDEGWVTISKKSNGKYSAVDQQPSQPQAHDELSTSSPQAQQVTIAQAQSLGEGEGDDEEEVIHISPAMTKTPTGCLPRGFCVIS